MKNGKATGIDNVPTELMKDGGDIVCKVLQKICNEAWNNKKWPEQWTKSILIPLPKKGDLKKCSNYRTISLISHPSKVLLRIILNRLKPQIEPLIADVQAGFRKERSTVEQITNIRILCEKYRNKGKKIYHNFIDYKKAFDRVWQEALWATMKKHNIDHKLVDMVQALYKDTKNTVLVDNVLGDWFETSVGVRQGCILSPYLFNIFLEQIMIETLENFQGNIRIGGMEISNLRFADDIDLIGESETELQNLTTRLDTTSRKFGMEISTEKSKILVTGKTEDITEPQIYLNGEKLENVDKFKYLGTYITENVDTDLEIKCRLAMAITGMTKLDVIWKNKKINIKSKIRLLRAITISTALYGCQSWTLNKSMETRIEAFENKAFRKMLRIPYTEHRTNESVRKEIKDAIGDFESLLSIVKKRKLQWYGHLTRQQNTLANTILEGSVEGKRKRGRPKKVWMDNIMEWTGMKTDKLLQKAKDRDEWRKTVKRVSNVPLRPLGLRD